MKKMPNKDRPLKTRVTNGVLRIEIGVNTLAECIAVGNAFHKCDNSAKQYIRDFAIIDAVQFARDIARELEAEKEDGSSPLSMLFDQAAQSAIDDGSLGVEFDQQIEFEKKSPKETW